MPICASFSASLADNGGEMSRRDRLSPPTRPGELSTRRRVAPPQLAGAAGASRCPVRLAAYVNSSCDLCPCEGTLLGAAILPALFGPGLAGGKDAEVGEGPVTGLWAAGRVGVGTCPLKGSLLLGVTVDTELSFRDK
jgi:hypothetical protein